jgi:hypothetical protein
MSIGVEGNVTEWVVSILTELSTQNKNIIKNQRILFEKIDEVKLAAEQIGQKIDEQVLREGRAGMRHLVDGINSEIESARKSELQFARQIFARLIELDPDEVTTGTSSSIDNKILISLGYYGSFHYFNILGDKRNAAIQVYECVEKWIAWENPLFALELFPQSFFSQNYIKILSQLYRDIENLLINIKDHDSVFNENAAKAGATVGNAGAAIAWLLMGSINPLALGAGIVGYIAAGSLFKRKNLKEADKDKISNAQNVLSTTFSDLEEECKFRHQALQKTTLEAILNLGWRSQLYPLTKNIEEVINRSNHSMNFQDQVNLKNKVNVLKEGMSQRNIS